MNIDILTKIFIEFEIDIQFLDIDLALPLAYKKKFDIKEVLIDGATPYIVIKEKRRGTLERFISQAEHVQKVSGLEYILVFSSLSNDERRLLLKARIPFIDYKGNLFLPVLGLILRKNLEIIHKETFSPSEQLVLTYLLTQAENVMVPSTIEKKTGLSIPSIYRVLKEFVRRGWLFSEYGGYHIAKSKEEIVSESKDLLFNPIKKRIYISQEMLMYLENDESKWYVWAGTYALSHFSMLSESEQTIAMSHRNFNQLLKKNPITFYEEKISNLVELQLWYYSPISWENDWIDPFSLYLSLRESDDLRVESELSKIRYTQLGGRN